LLLSVLILLCKTESLCTTTAVNIRSGPSTSDTVLWTANKGDTFSLLSSSGDWNYLVSTSGSHVETHGYGFLTYFEDCATPVLLNYSRDAAMKYVTQFWKTPNHDCKRGYQECAPWSCWGEYCGYNSHGGDCANFVSQSLITGGHPFLNQGAPCRGYPCGKEEVGATNLGNCLKQVHGWKRTCGNRQPPPAGIQIGDVLIFHSGSCTSMEAHATIVTQVNSKTDVRISCHSPSLHNQLYTDVSSTKMINNLIYFGHPNIKFPSNNTIRAARMNNNTFEFTTPS